MAQRPSGWYTDPTGRYMYRYWDGRQWMSQVSSGGPAATDPTPMEHGAVTVPPAPGTDAPTPPQAQPAQTIQVTQKRGSAFGTIVGVVLAIVAIVVLIVILINASNEDTSTTEAPATTQAVTATTQAVTTTTQAVTTTAGE